MGAARWHLAIYLPPKRQGTGNPCMEASQNTLAGLSLPHAPHSSLNPNLHCPLPLASLSLTPASSPPSRYTSWMGLDAICMAPELQALLPSQGCFPPCQTPSLILGACHSQLPASHPGPGKEMRPRNSGAEPPTAREMLTHSQCILTQGNSQQSQRAVPGLLGAPLSVLLQAWI